MAIPKQQDFPGLVGFIRTPAIDPNGRLVYQGTLPRPPAASLRHVFKQRSVYRLVPDLSRFSRMIGVARQFRAERMADFVALRGG